MSELQVLQVRQCVKMKASFSHLIPHTHIHTHSLNPTTTTTIITLFSYDTRITQIQGHTFLSCPIMHSGTQKNKVTSPFTLFTVLTCVSTTSQPLPWRHTQHYATTANMAHAGVPAITRHHHSQTCTGFKWRFPPLTRIAFPSNEMTPYYLIAPRGKYV